MTHKYASLPWKSPLVVKYGGSTMPGNGPEDPLLDEVALLWKRGQAIVLIHGGGPEIDAALAAAGLVTSRIDGLRITDAATLGVTEQLLCGTINKRLVRCLVARGLPAVGISGQDDALLRAQRSERYEGRLGLVGENITCTPRLIDSLLSAGMLPVIAPLAISQDGTHALNVNADDAAAAIAGAIRTAALLFVTDVPKLRRVADDPRTAIDRLTVDEARALLLGDSCRDGMRPKLRAAVDAREAGAEAVYLCAAAPHAIESALDSNGGTRLE